MLFEIIIIWIIIEYEIWNQGMNILKFLDLDSRFLISKNFGFGLDLLDFPTLIKPKEIQVGSKSNAKNIPSRPIIIPAGLRAINLKFFWRVLHGRKGTRTHLALLEKSVKPLFVLRFMMINFA